MHKRHKTGLTRQVQDAARVSPPLFDVRTHTDSHPNGVHAHTLHHHTVGLSISVPHMLLQQQHNH